MRHYGSNCCDTNGLVQKYVGTSYDNVKFVADNMHYIKIIYDMLTQYNMLACVESVEQLKNIDAIQVRFARIYELDRLEKRYVDYAFIDNDESGIKPNGIQYSGSWIKVGTSSAGTGGDGSCDIAWVYNNGSAQGGEKTIIVPEQTAAVTCIYVNGNYQYPRLGFEYDEISQTIRLAQPLEEGDTVIAMLSGLPADPETPNVDNFKYFNWVYNNGKANGGEQTFRPPYNFKTVVAVFINGLRKEPQYHFTWNNEGLVQLREPVKENDFVVIQIGGDVHSLLLPNVMSGYTFKGGATLRTINDHIYDSVSKKWYQWIGLYPRRINENTIAADQINADGGIWSDKNPSGLWLNLSSINQSKSDIFQDVAITHSNKILVGSNNITYNVSIIGKNPSSLEIYYGEEVTKTVDAKLKVKKHLISELYEKYPSSAMFNASAFVTDEDEEYAYPVGLQIANGIAYQDFNKVSQNQYDNKLSVLVMKDGSLKLARATDNKTAQNYVDEGAWLSLGWHLVSIWDGKIYQASSDPDRSARTVFGRINGKDFAIFQSEGKTGKYGLTSTELENLLLSLGFTEAVQLDGGGSTQSIWNNENLIISSDSVPRKIGGGVLAVKCSARNLEKQSNALFKYIACNYSIEENEISIPRVGMSLAGIKAIYDQKENKTWLIPRLNGELVSFDPPSITTTVATQNLGGYNVNALNFFKNSSYTFTSGFTLKYVNETIVYNGAEYRWGGTLPKTFTTNDNPVDNPTNWINVGSNSIIMQSSGTSKTAVMSQNAVKNYVSPGSINNAAQSRKLNETYVNSSNKHRFVSIQGKFNSSASSIDFKVEDDIVLKFSGDSGELATIFMPVPPNNAYAIKSTSGTFVISSWYEY